VLGGRGDTLKSVANRCVEFSLLPRRANLTGTSYGFQKVYNSLDILAWNHAYAYSYSEPQAMLIIAPGYIRFTISLDEKGKHM
jgi:hypothetical protein